jgi:hypothetical protein
MPGCSPAHNKHLNGRSRGPQNTKAENNGLERTPVLAWSSWSFLRKQPTAANVKAQARETLAKKYHLYIDLLHGKKWIFYPRALELPMYTKGNIFRLKDGRVICAARLQAVFLTRLLPAERTFLKYEV